MVFATTYHEYAIEALRQRAFDYLLKPLDRDELQACSRSTNALYKQERKNQSSTPAPEGLKSLQTGKDTKHEDILHIEMWKATPQCF